MSRLVNLVIDSPLFGLLREGARARIKDTAEKRGVPWQQRVFELEHSGVFEVKEQVEDKALIYPEYYTRAFHGAAQWGCMRDGAG